MNSNKENEAECVRPGLHGEYVAECSDDHETSKVNPSVRGDMLENEDKKTQDNNQCLNATKSYDAGKGDQAEIRDGLHEAEKTSKEEIDIDEFLIRSGECGRYQFITVIKMMIISFPLAYTPFIFYFIGFDPHWVNVVNNTQHSRENNQRCSMNRSQWRYDYEKTTMTTEVSSSYIVLNRFIDDLIFK